MTASIRPGVRLSIVRPGLRPLFGRSLIPYLLRCMGLLLAHRDASLLRTDMSGIGAEADMRRCLARLPAPLLTLAV